MSDPGKSRSDLAPDPTDGSPPPTALDATDSPADEGGDNGEPSPPAPPADGAADSPVDKAAAPKGASDDDSSAPDPASAWKAKKFDKTYAQLQEARKQLEEERKKHAAAAPDDPNAPRLTEEEVNRRANEIAAQADFTRRCNEVAAQARKNFGDFDTKLNSFRQLVDANDPTEVSAYMTVLSAALETGDAGRLLYELGGDQNQAMKMLELANSPVKLGIEMAKMAAKKSEPEPSDAPPPIKPVGGRTEPTGEIQPDDPARADKLSKKAWFERREKQIAAKRQAGERIW